MKLKTAVTIAAAASVVGCSKPQKIPDMNPLAERYVKLVLQVGQHDKNFVDAYYGDQSWRPTGTPLTLTELGATATALRTDVQAITLPPEAEAIVQDRRDFLSKQLAAVETRIGMLGNQTFSFNEEAERLYDVAPPIWLESDSAPILNELQRLLPGNGLLVDRYEEFRKRFVIPPAKVDAVFRAAIDGCRTRTLEHLKLPGGETFTVEYVRGKSWSAYNWYKGNYTSVIQVNLDLPITIDRAIDLACHEGYPGHHVYNALLEKHLVHDRGWVEFSIYPLFSPQSLIAEGTANFGIEVAFPGDERTKFEKEKLYPLAGLDPATAELYAGVQRLVAKLSFAGNEAARRYLTGKIDRAGAVEFLQRWAMMPKDRAEQRTHFFDEYRSYVINYNVGQELVRDYVERRGGTDERPDIRWQLFTDLLSSPRLPSSLK